MKDLADRVKESSDHVKSVQYYTLDGAVIPDCEVLEHRNNLPFIMNLNSQYSYSINLNPNFSIIETVEDKNRMNEEAYIEYTQGIGLPKYQAFLLSNFASKVHQSIPSTEIVKTEDIMKGIY